MILSFFKARRAFFTAVVAIVLGAVAWPAAALTISPIIIVIEGKSRYADVSLINGGDVPKTYEVGWQFFRMEEGIGKYLYSETSVTDFDLTKNIVFTPKRVTLGPNSVQKIRLGMRLQGEPPPPGDYRAHLELREADSSPESTVVSQEAAADAEKNVLVGIKMNVGFTVPVIYRVGEPDVTAEIGEITTAINPNNNKIEASVPVSLGDSSYGVLGHMRVYYDGAQVGEVGNANIFPEARQRTFKVPLNVEKLSGGSLRIVLMDRDRSKNKMYAQKIVPVGK